MALIDELRRKFPEFDGYSDAELIQAAAPAFGGSVDRAMRYFGVEQSSPGITTDIKRGTGQVLRGLGSTARDFGMESIGRQVENVGEDITFRNPGEINSFRDVLSRPGTTLREAVGEMVPQLGAAAATGWAGAKAGGLMGSAFGPAGTAIGAAIGGIGSAAATMFGQTYGSIRAEQREQGIDDRGRAALAAVPATALEFLGPEAAVLRRVAGKGLRTMSDDAARRIAEQGAVRYYGTQAAKQGVLEGPLTEVPQTALERFGAFKDVTSPEAFDEYGVAGAKGFAGGAVFGGAFSAPDRWRAQAQVAQIEQARAEAAARLQAGESVDLTQGGPLMLGYTQRRMISYPDGSVGYEDRPGDWNMANMLRDTAPAANPARELDLMQGAGGTSSAFSVLNQAIPMPQTVSDAAGVIQTLQEEAQRGRPMRVGSPEHQAFLAAQQILDDAGLKFPLDESRIPPPYSRTDDAPVANQRQMSTSAEVSPQPAEVELTPLGEARKAFAEAGGKRGDWAKMVDGTDGDINVLAQKIEARVNNPRTSSESAKRWAAVLDTIRKGANNGVIPNEVGQQQGATQPGATAREGLPAQAVELGQPGGQTGQLGADGGRSGSTDVQTVEGRQVALADAINGLSQKQKQYWDLRMGLHAMPEETADAEIARQMGVSRQRVAQLRTESQKKVAKALGLTVQQVQGDLQSVLQGHVVEGPLSFLTPRAPIEHTPPDAPESRLAAFEDREGRLPPGSGPLVLAAVGDDADMGVVSRPDHERVIEDTRTARETREGNAVLKAGEGVAQVQTAEEQRRDAEMQAQREARAATERAKFVVEMLSHPEAKNASVDWNDGKSEASPAWGELSPVGQAKFVADYVEQLDQDSSWKAIEAMIRDFERQLGGDDVGQAAPRELQDARTAEAQPGRAGVSAQAQGAPGGESRAPEQPRAPEAPQRAEGPAPQPEDKAPAREGIKPLSEIQVKVTAIDVDTGREITMDEKADVALREVDEQLAKARSLLECLAS